MGLTGTSSKANLGLDCSDLCTRADLNRNRRIDADDAALLTKQTGACDPALCSGDLDGNGKVNVRDVNLMIEAENTCKPSALPPLRMQLSRGSGAAKGCRSSRQPLL